MIVLFNDAVCAKENIQVLRLRSKTFLLRENVFAKGSINQAPLQIRNNNKFAMLSGELKLKEL